MSRRIRALAVIVTFVISLAAVQPAGAIQYGEPDNGAHPYVGGLIFQVNGNQFVGCSGTMIGPTTFLTAAHCFPDDVFQLIGVTFDDAFVPGESTVIPLDNSTFIGNPAYDGTPYTDVAVVLLPYDPGVGYVSLPTLGYLETLAPRAQPGNQSRSLTAVGYGTTGLNRGAGGPPQFVYPDVRMRAENRIIGVGSAVHAGYLVQTTASPGNGGGTCYGDSGGPFLEKSTSVVYVVAITITGFNQNCGGADLNLRTDISSVQDFIWQYI
ncbi:MAG TPA: S1 family peptidase [Thermomicrobiales bacterium]|jgi:hypothetical protein|nr:S1 family peptidase [Thermomicrobiales bacterium]